MKLRSVKWVMFIIIAIGNFLSMLDSTIVNLALYPMSKDLGVEIVNLQWIIISYAVVQAVFLPFWGKVGELIPKNRLYSIGFGIFAAGSFLNFLAPNFPFLICSRMFQIHPL